MAKMSAAELQNQLGYFTGSLEFTGYLGGVLLTEGVRFLCEKAEAFWLADAICSYKADPVAVKEAFQVWKLVRKGDGAVLTMTDGNERQVVQQEIEWTDFPLEEVTLWLTDDVLLLPSEY